MLDDVDGACAEAATGAERAGERADDHVDGGGVDILGFGDAAAGAAEDAEGPGLVEDKAEFVAEAEFNLGALLARSSDKTRELEEG